MPEEFHELFEVFSMYRHTEDSTSEQRIFFADLHSTLDLVLVDLMCKLKNMKTTWQPSSL